MKEFEKKVLENIKSHDLLEDADSVTVAVSGGADSVALLLAMTALGGELGITVRAIHVEHGIRGEESRADADFVQSLCDRLNVELTTCHVDVPSFAEEKGLGTEEAARILRYQCFAELGYGTRLALAHHVEDQAETVLFQLARGTGLKGLCGMRPRRVEEGAGIICIRPLLNLTREEIEAYLAECAQTYREDSTNTDDSLSRNFIRQNLLPDLLHLNSGAVTHIGETAQRLQEAEDFFSACARETFVGLKRPLPKQTDDPAVEACLALDQKGLKDLHPALRSEVLRLAVGEVSKSLKDISAVHIESLADLITKGSGKCADLPYELRGVRAPGLLLIEKRKSGSHAKQMGRNPKK